MVKLLLLKVSVGAIVVQGLIESFVFSSGASPYGDDDEFSAEDKTLRAYCECLFKLMCEKILTKSYYNLNWTLFFVT